MFSGSKRFHDRLVGEEQVNLQEGTITKLSYTFRVPGPGADEEQIKLAEEVVAEYSRIWAVIYPELLGKLPLEYMSERLLLYIPGIVEESVYEFMLGYEFDFDRRTSCAFFGFAEGELAYIHMDAFN